MRAILTSVAIAVGMTGASYAADLAIPDQQFSVSIRDQNVRDVLNELSVAIGIPIIVSGAVDGRVSASFEEASASELLDRIAAKRALDWRFDGRRIEVTARSEQKARIVDLGGVRMAELAGALESLGVYQEAFPITAVDGEFAMIVAPPNYTALVEVVLGALIKRHAEAQAEMQQAKALNQQQQLERARAETALRIEQQRAELRRQEAIRREQDRRERRGPVIVRNGVWGG